MTKKDYFIIARAIAETYALQDETMSGEEIRGFYYALEILAERAIVHMQRDNVRFDKEKFIEILEMPVTMGNL